MDMLVGGRACSQATHQPGAGGPPAWRLNSFHTFPLPMGTVSVNKPQGVHQSCHFLSDLPSIIRHQTSRSEPAEEGRACGCFRPTGFHILPQEPQKAWGQG